MTRPQPIAPQPGQESVWDYPRPPRLETSTELVEVVLGGVVVARTQQSWRVLETSHPPTYYLPREAFEPGVLRDAAGSTWCEWKGQAAYFDLVAAGVVAPSAAWTYPAPTTGFETIAGAVAVMPGAVDRCTVDGEVVEPQPGGFYGGWITSKVVGPFKGTPGTRGW
ncbi:hypothetical protein NSZ01_30290 [Nocardioides szechwanensis]|uniref:Uncharacterized conserved protein, DUF427 family n=1 Tax=Nocardioides szechwanensis TaxID=1005944 RepID=A0A1H0DVX5_9ACTN|nr:DUF427 domain-containing protein [Nocardioides szechwanensis]GEP35261.1 hypothetical protein NSZ01_30290 [Nocardioides szechwanensis]SDN74417.1 Uncharacterized conserved protein, DUF427 family [Nocardioides szechwanensis]